MDLSFDSVDSVYEPFDWTYDLTGLQFEPTSWESDLTDYNTYVSTAASVCEQTETFDSVNSVYQSMEPTYGLTGLQCEPTSFSYAPTALGNDLKDFHSYAPTEEPFEQTEGKAWRLLAARIPPELFDDILFYVNVDRVSQRQEDVKKYGRDLIRNRGEPILGDILTHLKQCSLVCLFWANRCRRYMFSERTLEINSYEDAEIFRRYFVGGSSRLTPVHRLISGIRVRQDYGSQRSFLHLLYLPAIQDKLESLTIHGPVPVDFNPAKLDTPHWGIPPCTIVVPSSFLQNTKIYLMDVHLPSFYHVAKYIKHFSHATSISFRTITWNEQMAVALPYASSTSTIACQRRPRSLTIMAWGGCTNSVHLALTALMLNPNCPLHRLSEAERVWMIEFMTLLWSDEPDPDVDIGFNVSVQTTTMRAGLFHFVFEEATAFTDRSASALSVVGLYAYIDVFTANLPANFDALVNHARTYPTIRALVLLFDSFADLQVSVGPFVEVLSLAADTIKIVLAYEKEEECQAVGVDLVTLEQNGRVHTWADEQSEDFGGRAVSLQMLQRQLKKNRWMSVH